MSKIIKIFKPIIEKYGFFGLFLVVGLLIFFYPMFISGFDLMMGDGEDVKLLNYILEHSWLFINRVQFHTSFWDMPFYYPMKNTLALSDMLIGGMPFYWVIRAFLKSPFSALQIWVILVSFLNYSSFYWLLREVKISRLASSFGAFIFAFSLMRYFRLGNIAYIMQFYTILALIFIVKIYKSEEKLKSDWLYYFLISLCLALQFASCFFLGWSFCFWGGVFICLCFCFKENRQKILNFLFKAYKKIFFSAVVFFLFLSPCLKHYFMVQNTRNIASVDFFSQHISAWIRSVSFLDNQILNFINFNFNMVEPVKSMEACAGIGFFATLLLIFSIFKIKERYIKIPLTLTLILIAVFSVKFNEFLPWRILYNIIPGASATRAIIRNSFIALIFSSFLIAKYLDDFKKNKPVAWIIIFLLSVEMIPQNINKYSFWKNYSWSKSAFSEEIKNASIKIENNCKLISCRYIDKNFDYKKRNGDYIHQHAMTQEKLACMYIADKKGIRTIDGYSGFLYYSELLNSKDVCRVYIEKSYGDFE